MIKKRAHRILYRDGRLAGVQTPYNREFAERAKGAGYTWTGTYWKDDLRPMLDERPMTPEEIEQTEQQKREELVTLAAEFFDFGPDQLFERPAG